MSEKDVLLGLLLSVQASVEAAIKALRDSEPASNEFLDDQGNCLHPSVRTISTMGGEASVRVCLSCGEQA
jgi:hypothetical protein